MSVLSNDDRDVLRLFFERLLDLHAGGAVTTESAIDYLSRVVDTVDLQTPQAISELRVVLEDAWQEDDA